MRWHIPECGVKSQAHPNSKRWAPLSTTDPLRAEGQQGGLWPLPPAPVSKGTERSQGHCSTRVPTVLKAKVKGGRVLMDVFPRSPVMRIPPSSPSSKDSHSLDFPSHAGNPHSHHSPRSHRGCRTCILCTATCRSWQPQSCSGWTAGRWGDLEEAEMAALRPEGLTCHPLHTTLCLTWREGGRGSMCWEANWGPGWGPTRPLHHQPQLQQINAQREDWGLTLCWGEMSSKSSCPKSHVPPEV